MNEIQSFLTTLLEYPYGWVVLVVLILSALAALIVIAVIAAKGANSSLEKLLEVIGKMSDNRRMELGITDKTVTLLT